MYNQFYGFSEKPFNLTPDPKFLYLTTSHREALASMIYGIKERRGFISITGEVGTGKTTLIYTLLNNLNEKIKTVFIYHTNTTFEQLLKNILMELNVPIDNEDKTSLLHKLNEYLIQRLSQEETLAIIIDEAQNLPKEVMEELRMLSNLETCKSKLLQIVLVGQPELEVKLNSADLRQLKQRIGIRRQIKPLSQEESKKYIEHRLKLVGSSSSNVFTPEAISLIVRHARGIPRTINILCDNAFLIGYSASKKKINTQIIKEVISDMDGSTAEPIRQQAEAVKLRPVAPKIKASYNKIAVPILSLLCLGLIALLGREYLQPDITPSKAQDIRYAKNLNASPPPQSSFNSNLSAGEIKTDLVSDSNDPPEELEATTPQPLQPITASLASLLTEPEPASTESLKPALPPPTSLNTLKKEDNIKLILTVRKGNCISYLAQKYYHMTNETLVDLILKVNPSITNAHLIKVNQQIKIPEITEESLIIKSSDNTYKIHMGTFQTPDYAQLYYDEPALMGKEINIIPLKVSPHDTWYRVVLGKFDTKAEGLKTMEVLKQKGLLPCFATTKGTYFLDADSPR